MVEAGLPEAKKPEDWGRALGVVEQVRQSLEIFRPEVFDVPLTHINAAYVRSHFDAIEVRVPGAPAHDEIVYILAMSTGARIHQPVGGLKAGDIPPSDGQR